MTLTEQWKKGELEDGFYYVKLVDEEDGKTITDKYCSSFRGWEDSENWQISEVLAPVPSYEEWQKVLNIDFNNEVLRLENAKLKELLLVCREMLEEYRFSEGDFTIGDNAEIDTSLLLKKIDNAIGEKK